MIKSLYYNLILFLLTINLFAQTTQPKLTPDIASLAIKFTTSAKLGPISLQAPGESSKEDLLIVDCEVYRPSSKGTSFHSFEIYSLKTQASEHKSNVFYTFIDNEKPKFSESLSLITPDKQTKTEVICRLELTINITPLNLSTPFRNEIFSSPPNHYSFSASQIYFQMELPMKGEPYSNIEVIELLNENFDSRLIQGIENAN